MALISKPLMQIILYVKDMGSAVRFYHEILGLPIRYPAGLADYANEMWVEFETGDCTLALHGGDHEKPEGKHEIVFEVEDVEAARGAIIAGGIEMKPTRILEDGAPIAEGIDPAGHRFAIRAST
jgi:predicted enzyme related to lactoylglutathione lyase